VPSPRRRPRGHYTTDSYRRAIARACDQAFPPPPPLAQRDDETAGEWRKRLTPEQRAELLVWRKAHRWHPHQLRHSAATRVRKQFGLDAAQVVLGHKSADVAQIYAEADLAKAEKIMSEIG
jgi:integrase